MQAQRTVWPLLAALVLAACSDDASTVGTVPGSTTTVVVATTTAPTMTTTSSTTTAAPTTTAPTTTAPTTTVRVPAWAGDVLVVAADGLWSVPATGAPARLVPAPVANAAVGPDGTVYFQRRSSHDTDPAELDAATTRIEALDRRSGAVRTVLAPPAARSPAVGALTLEGVIVVDGRPELLLRRFRHDPTKDVELQSSEVLVRRDLATGAERDVRVSGAWEFGMALVGHGGGVFVTVGRSEGSERVLVFGPDGADAGGPVAAALPSGFCSFATAGCADTATVSPSGTRVAWIEADAPVSSSEVPWRLVIVDVATRRRLRDVALEPRAAEVELVFADDDHVLVGRVPWPTGSGAPAPEGHASVVEVTSGTVRPLAVGGAVRPDVGA